MKSEQLSSWLKATFTQLVNELLPGLQTNGMLYDIIAVTTILCVSALVYACVRLFVRPQIAKWVKRSRVSWDDALLDHGFVRRLLHLVPATLIFVLSPVLLDEHTMPRALLMKGALLYMVFTGLIALYALLSTLEDIYNSSAMAKRAPITGFVQVAKLAFAIIALLLTISIVIERSPLLILSGLTALAAVLLLIFRDTILGFVSGIQIAANRMFNTGDWIQIPKYDVDGEITEIGLTNVKVQNWDKTISTMPTYTLTSEAVKNWRGMQESGGRRIKRAILIDINTVTIATPEMLEQWSQIRCLKGYIKEKLDSVSHFHSQNSISETDRFNSRKLTNIGTFRAYLEAYLRNREDVNQSMTLMVRQLAPTELGLPLEIYCFSAKQDWVSYEKLQADIFDHVMAMLAIFSLRAYQRDSHLALRLTHAAGYQAEQDAQQ